MAVFVDLFDGFVGFFWVAVSISKLMYVQTNKLDMMIRDLPLLREEGRSVFLIFLQVNISRRSGWANGIMRKDIMTWITCKVPLCLP